MTTVDTSPDLAEPALAGSLTATVEAALRELATVPVVAASDESVVDEIRQQETIARLAMARQARLIAEAQRRNLPAQRGARSTSAWLQRTVRITPGEAKTRVIGAEAVQERTALSGEPLPPPLPAAAEAFSQGEVGLEHVRVIADGMAALPNSVAHGDRDVAERTLIEHAHTLAPDKVRVLAARIRSYLDQDGTLRDEEHQYQRRELHLATGRDGMTVLKGRLDKETGAKLRAILNPLAAPRPATNGERDPRSAGQRNADALDTVLDIALASDEVPTSGGQPAHLSVTIDYETLRADLNGETLDGAVVDGAVIDGAVRGSGTLDATGDPISASAARRLACDATIVPIVLGSNSEPLDVGRLSYTVPTPMRQALLARDGSCAMPACDRPPGTSHAHHCQAWADGGKTSVDDLIMLCGFHHRMVHAEGWQASIRDGRPEFIPPRSIDPTQTPLRSPGRKSDFVPRT